jgi:signal transduction histidine kinase
MSNKTKIFEAINRFVNVPSTDPDDSRRRRLLNIILLFVGVLTFLTLVGSLLISRFSAVSSEDMITIIISTSVTLVAVLFLFFINRVSAGWFASAFFLLFLSIVLAFSDTPEELIAGRSLLVFTIPIVMASILLRPFFSFIFAGITFVEIYIIGMVAGEVRINPVAIAVFFMVAAISWLSSRTLEQALGELRIINAELDQRVIDRTHELSESLAREAAQAKQREAILNSIADGVVVFDNSDTAIVANPSLSSLTSVPQNGILGRSLTELLDMVALPAEEHARISDAFKHLEGAQSMRINWGKKTLSVSAADVQSEEGEPLGKVAVFRDVTREAELEKMKDTFLAVVSHELRTPLNAILGFAEMIRETVYGPVSDRQIRASSRIMENTRRLLAIVSELLDQAQIQSGRMKIHLEPCSLAELQKGLQDTMEKIAMDKGVKLYTEVDPALPSTLMGDSHRLQQILINLTANAIKFSPQDGEVRVSFKSQGREYWQIQVADTGEGIPPEDMEYIFETFRQVEVSATRRHGGVGLGLAIVKQLVELMNGRIAVESLVNVGSVFTITLPLITK